METNSIVFFSDKDYSELPSKPVIAAWETSTPENIGSIIRVADNLGAKQVFVIGEEFNLRLSSIKKTAGLSYNNIELLLSTPEEFFDKIEEGHQLVAIETSTNSKNLFTTLLPEKIVFLLGNEKHGLSKEILTKCHQIVHIPMTGKCKSMNVSHALAVAAFEWQRQMLFLDR